MSHATTLAVCLLAGSAAAWSPTTVNPQQGVRQRTVVPAHAVVSRRVAQQPVALFGAGALRREGAALLAPAPKQPLLRSASLALKLILSTLASVLGLAARAYAADRLKSVPTSTVATAPFVLTGDMIKWGVFGAACGAAYLFRREEVPIVTVTEDPDAAPSAAPTVTVEITGEGGEEAPAEMDIMSDLHKRMQQLAEERAAAQGDAPNDSTDEWGTGNTAVLEPPNPDAPQPPSSLLEDGPVVDFPVGFPLRGDIEEQPEPEAAATKEQIEMLERMFGSRGKD